MSNAITAPITIQTTEINAPITMAKNAYQLAVDAGYEGTLEDFISAQSGDVTNATVNAAIATDPAATRGALEIDLSAFVEDDDPRLTDARTPTAHAASHHTGGTDPITPANIGAATAAQGTLAISSANTGIISGGVLSINGDDATKIDISAGSGYVIDDTVSPPTATLVTWSTHTAVTLTDLATENSTDIAINAAGAVVQQRRFTNTELRSVILLGGIDHAGGTVNNTFPIQVPAFAAGLSVRDLARAVGDINLEGNAFSAAGSNLAVTKSAGSAFSFGRNAATSKTDPHIIEQASLAAASFNYISRDGSGGVTVGPSVSAINPLNFDNGSGTLATVPVNDYAFQQFLLFSNSNNVFVQYGSTTFNTLKEAIAGLASTTFPDLPGFTTAMRRGVLIVKRGTTNLSTEADARFFVADKFGSIAGAVGAGATASGDVVGPASATDGAVALYDGTTGKLIKDGVVLGGAAQLNVGTGSGTVASGDDARLSDAREPTAHAVSHATGGADPITPGDIGAANASHTHQIADVQDLQAELDGKAPADVVTDYIDGTNSLAIASGVVAVDAANGRSQKLTLTEDVTEFQTPTNLADGQSMVITGKQDATGERAFNLASSGYVLVGGEEADISALTSNQRFLISIIRDGVDYLATLATQ